MPFFIGIPHANRPCFHERLVETRQSPLGITWSPHACLPQEFPSPNVDETEAFCQGPDKNRFKAIEPWDFLSNFSRHVCSTCALQISSEHLSAILYSFIILFLRVLDNPVDEKVKQASITFRLYCSVWFQCTLHGSNQSCPAGVCEREKSGPCKVPATSRRLQWYKRM